MKGCAGGGAMTHPNTIHLPSKVQQEVEAKQLVKKKRHSQKYLSAPRAESSAQATAAAASQGAHKQLFIIVVETQP